jgi:hypothetical protein
MHAYEEEGTFWDIGPLPYVKAHGRRAPIVEVDIAEFDPEMPFPDSTHWGWISAGEDEPSMIYPHPTLLETCFPYGMKAEEAAGNGRPVRLIVVRADPEESLDDLYESVMVRAAFAQAGVVGRAVLAFGEMNLVAEPMKRTIARIVAGMDPAERERLKTWAEVIDGTPPVTQSE